MLNNLGMPDIPLIVTPHPIGGLQLEDLSIKANQISQDIIELIGGGAG